MSRTACVSPQLRQVQEVAPENENVPVGQDWQVLEVLFRNCPAGHVSHDVPFQNCPEATGHVAKTHAVTRVLPDGDENPTGHIAHVAGSVLFEFVAPARA